ncbi:25S rRNA (adenine(645)-N(1))-methyltransferase [[Candida] railenensis]|uniref:Ribosomal RNA-processing protein 8 n=1 Tax=[Candida] railenensis TaxID=45579 RepID=A0A9P0VXA3_9ASCO|nr:25S rRNA (adenine(645)-N(1))-methyltransferase [[Candida] railenensis]
MPLFQVDGWDLKEKNIKVGGNSTKTSKREKKRARLEDRKIAREAESAESDEVGVAKPDGEAEEVPVKRAKTESSLKKDKKGKKEDTVAKKIQPKVQKEEKDKAQNELEAAPAQSSFGGAGGRKLTPLQQKMLNKLSGSRFRWINEQLYTISSENALSLIKDQPALFDEYHEGFRSQVQSWPENPVDVFVDQIKSRATTRVINAPGGLPGLPNNKKVVIADMGCGEAMLSLQVSQFLSKHNKKSNPKKRLDIQVHSFDLKKVNPRITVADIKNVPLPDNSCTVVIFCLALMGTNFLDFIKEAYRILAPRGELWIAEIKSRFTEKVSIGGHGQALEAGTEFVEALKLSGFFHKKTDNDNKMFTRFEFFKPPPDILQERKEKLERQRKFIEVESEKEQLQLRREKQPEGEWLLKPCIYKRR